MNKTLYVSDLDGTLLNGEAVLSDRTKSIINKLSEQNIMFTYATARSYSSASQLLKDLNLCIPAITYNGTFFVNQKNGEIIESISFPKEIVNYIIEVIHRQNDYSPLVYALIDGEERVSYLSGRENEGITHYLQTRHGDRRLRKVTSLNELYQGEIFYFTFIGEKESLNTMREQLLSKQVDEKPLFTHTFQEELYKKGEYWLELMPAEASKAAGALRLKEMTGCDRIVCFGDAINDIPLFQVADEAFAVENAVPKLKELATGIIGSNLEDGVALWLLEHAF